MKKWKLWHLSFATMVFAGAGAFVIMVFFDGGFWTALPLLAWFVLGQIFIVPRILRNENKK